MTKSFYVSAIFVTCIYMAVVLFQSIVFVRLGALMYQLPSIITWSVFAYVTSVAWALVVLKYYHVNGYRLSFVTGIATVAASIVQFYLFYDLLLSREISMTYVVATLLLHVTGIAYASSLIFSRAAERKWLKTAGVLMLIVGIASLLSLSWALASVSARVNGTIETLEQWITLLSSLIPILFILNFRDASASAETEHALHTDGASAMTAFGGFIIIVAALIFVPRFAIESLRPADHPDNISERLKEMAGPFEARTFVNSEGDSLLFRLMKPLDFDSTRQYPLIVCLHGSSAVGNDNVKQVAATLPAQLLSEPKNRKKYPAFLFVPQCPRGFGWGGLPEHASVDSLVFEAIASIEREFPIDAKRRYISGYSMGGYGTWHFICARPEMFAAAVPICGGGDPTLADKIIDVPVWAFHGAKDMNAPVSDSRNMIEAMKRAGGNPRYTVFPDAAHNIWEEVYETRELLEWMFEQERDGVERSERLSG